MLCSNEHFGITSEDVDRANLDARNAETSRKEVAAWIADPPESYFVYVREERASDGGRIAPAVTTWTGDVLGKITGWGATWTDNMGSERRTIYVRGTNGVDYWGTYFKSAGDYARIRAFKVQA